MKGSLDDPAVRSHYRATYWAIAFPMFLGLFLVTICLPMAWREPVMWACFGWACGDVAGGLARRALGIETSFMWRLRK